SAPRRAGRRSRSRCPAAPARSPAPDRPAPRQRWPHPSSGFPFPISAASCKHRFTYCRAGGKSTVVYIGRIMSRDAGATRKNLILAARRHFASVGYERATVRAIAADADVNPALINRYFGGKEQLFAEAVSI